jgi:hypothetical protein
VGAPRSPRYFQPGASRLIQPHPPLTEKFNCLGRKRERGSGAALRRFHKTAGDKPVEIPFLIGCKLGRLNACTPATAQADRVKISAFQWRAAKLKPKVYGDQAEVAVTGADRGPVQSVTVPVDPIEAARIYQKIMGEG